MRTMIINVILFFLLGYVMDAAGMRRWGILGGFGSRDAYSDQLFDSGMRFVLLS